MEALIFSGVMGAASIVMFPQAKRMAREAALVSEESAPAEMPAHTEAPTSHATLPTTNILFAGFPDDECEQLEAEAEAAGMVVHKAVTDNLAFVCCGPNASVSRVSRARFLGAAIIDVREFRGLLAKAA